MRFAVASDDGRLLAAHTGRCRCFVIFDEEDGNAVRREERENTFTNHAKGRCSGDRKEGASLHSHGELLDALSDCAVLICRGMGPRLIADLSARGIRPVFCTEEDVDRAASLFAAGKLEQVEAPMCDHRRSG